MNNLDLQCRMTRKNYMRVFSIILGALFLISFSVDLNAQKANFSGSWAFNESKSELGQPAGGGGGGRGFGAGGSLNIKQDANNLTVDRVITRQGEQRTTTSKYTLDGKESVNTSNRGSSKSVAKWSADNKSLTISTTSTFEMDGQKRESKSVEVWTLADGGKSLVVNSTRSTQQGERKTKMVYDKK